MPIHVCTEWHGRYRTAEVSVTTNFFGLVCKSFLLQIKIAPIVHITQLIEEKVVGVRW